MLVDQVRGLGLREISGGFSKHHRAPSIRAACYAIAKPSTMVQKMQNFKKVRGHRNAVYCGNVFGLHVLFLCYHFWGLNDNHFSKWLSALSALRMSYVTS